MYVAIHCGVNAILQLHVWPSVWPDGIGVHTKEAMRSNKALASYKLLESGWVLTVLDVTTFKVPRMACQLAGLLCFQWFGHRLNLVVTNSIKDDPRVSRAVGVCLKLTTHFANSYKKKQALTAAQVELKLSQHSLNADCETRWGSKFNVMQRTLERVPAIRMVLSQDRNASHLVPTWQNVDILESVVKAGC